MLFKNVPNPLFYDLYIPYKSDTSNAGSSKKLHAIPIMILNKGGVISEGIFNFVPSSYICTKSLPLTFRMSEIWRLWDHKKNWLWHKLSNLYNVKCIPKLWLKSIMKKKIIHERQIKKIQKLEGSDFAHLFEDVTKLKKKLLRLPHLLKNKIETKQMTRKSWLQDFSWLILLLEFRWVKNKKYLKS